MEQKINTKIEMWSIEKSIAKEIGIMPAILLVELMQKELELNQEMFEYSSQDIENNLFISADLRRKYTDILVKKELITIVKKGLPSRYYYQINYLKYKEYRTKEHK